MNPETISQASNVSLRINETQPNREAAQSAKFKDPAMQLERQLSNDSSSIKKNTEVQKKNQHL